MLTREQIEEIQTENRERGVSIKKLLKEKGVSERQYYRWKRQYERPEAPEGFLPIVGAGLPTQVAAHLSGTAPSVKAKIVWQKNGPAGPEFCQTRQNLAVCHRTLALTRLEGITPCKTILIIGLVPDFS